MSSMMEYENENENVTLSNVSTGSSEHQESTEEVSTNTIGLFNTKVTDILTNPFRNKYYVEFANLCIFYQKMNVHNTSVLQTLANMLNIHMKMTVPVTESEAKNAIDTLDWNFEDAELYRFMTSFINL